MNSGCPCYGGVGLGILLFMTTIEKTRSRALIFWGVTALVLLAGYVDLARGGETLAPILLVVGYVVLIPLAILKG